MKEFDYIVVGGGIGGASIAYRLASEGSVALLERESQPGYHTTGRSVAVHTDSYGPEQIRLLAKASYDFIVNPAEEFSEVPLVHPLGIVFVATEEQKADLLAFLEMVQQLSPEIREISIDEVVSMVPVMNREILSAAFYDEKTVGMDVHAIHQGYLRGAKRSGAEVICNAQVQGMERRNGVWQVDTTAGEFTAPIVVNSAGAWADVLAEMAGARKVNIVPKRRTCIAFQGPEGVDVNSWPGIMDAHENYYFKPDAGAIIGSLGDETPDSPCDVQPDDYDVALTVDRIEKATTMEINKLTHKWAGLRCFVEDRLPVIGFAPDAEGFFWNAGQGGYGIATSPAWSSCAASLVTGKDLPDELAEFGINPKDFAPQRLWVDS